MITTYTAADIKRIMFMLQKLSPYDGPSCDTLDLLYCQFHRQDLNEFELRISDFGFSREERIRYYLFITICLSICSCEAAGRKMDTGMDTLLPRDVFTVFEENIQQYLRTKFHSSITPTYYGYLHVWYIDYVLFSAYGSDLYFSKRSSFLSFDNWSPDYVRYSHEAQFPFMVMACDFGIRINSITEFDSLYITSVIPMCIAVTEIVKQNGFSILYKMDHDEIMYSDVENIFSANHEFELGLRNCKNEFEEQLVIINAILRMRNRDSTPTCHSREMVKYEPRLDILDPIFENFIENFSFLNFCSPQSEGTWYFPKVTFQEMMAQKNSPPTSPPRKVVIKDPNSLQPVTPQQLFKRAERRRKRSGSPQSGWEPEKGWEPQGLFDSNISANPEILKTLNRAIGSIDRFTDVFSTIVDRTAPGDVDKLVDATNFASDSLKNLPKAFAKGESIFEKIKSSILDGVPLELSKHVFGSSSIVIFVGSSIHYIYTRDLKSAAIALGAGICALKYSDILERSGLWEKIVDFWKYLTTSKSEELAEPQSMSDSFAEDSITALLTLASCYSIGIEKPGRKFLTGIRTLSSFKGMKDSLISVFKVVMKAIEFGLNWFRTNVLMMDKIKLTSVGVDLFDEFFNETFEISKLLDANDFAINNKNFARVVDVVEMGEAIQKDVNKFTRNPDLMTALTTQLHIMRKLRDEFRNSHINSNTLKKEPQGILIIGAPGVGKSAFIPHFCAAYIALIYDDAVWEKYCEKATDVIYHRMAEMGYFDGLIDGIKIMTMDDAFQMVEAPSNLDGEAANIIRAGGIFPMIAHMAEIDKKGKMFINIDALVATTNQIDIRSETIRNQEALRRRFQYVYITVPKPEYTSLETRGLDKMNRKIDISLLPKNEDGEQVVHPSHLSFIQWDLKKQAEVGPVLNFDELVDRVVGDYKKRDAFHKSYERDILRTAEKYRNQKKWKDRLEEHEKHAEETENEPENPSVDLGPQSAFDIHMDDIDDIEEGEDPYDINVSQLYSMNPSIEAFVRHVEEGLGPKYQEADREKLLARLDLVTRAVKRLTEPMKDFFSCENNLVCLTMMTERFGKRFVRAFSNPDPVKFGDFMGDVMRSRPFVEKELPKMITAEPMLTHVSAWNETWKVLKNSMNAFYTGFLLPCLKSTLHVIGNLIKNKFVWLGLFSLAAGALLKFSWNSAAAETDSSFSLRSSKNYAAQMAQAPDLVKSMIEDPEHAIDILEGVPNIELVNEVTRGLYIYNREVYSNLFKNLEPESVNHSVSLRHQKAKSKVKYVSFREMRGPQGVLTNLDDSAEKVVLKNTCMMSAETSPGSGEFGKLGNILFVKGMIALVPFHYLQQLHVLRDKYADASSLRIKLDMTKVGRDRERTCQTTLGFVMENVWTEELEKHDLCLIAFPKHFQPRGDILNKFISEKELNKVCTKSEASLVTIGQYEIETRNLNVNLVASATGSGVHHDYRIAQAWKYFAKTRNGDCGSILFTKNNSISGKILGLHVLGGGNTGAFATCTLREVIEHDVAHFTGVETVSLPGELDTHPQSGIIVGDGQFLDLYDTDPIHQPTQSKIERSLLYEAWGPAITAPARLTKMEIDGKLISPLELAINKYCTPDIYLDQDILDACANHLYDTLRKNSPFDVDFKVMDFETVVSGVPGEKCFSGISMSTSVGYPKVKESRFKRIGKKIYCNGGEIFDFDAPISKELEQEVESILASAVELRRMTHMFIDCMKDERRLLEKVFAGKTRAFSVSPLAYFLAWRRLFGSTSLWLTKNCLHNDMMVGANPYTDWHALALKMMKFGGPRKRNMSDLDYACFDGSQKPQIHWTLLYRIVLRLYSDEMNDARQVLWFELCNAIHIMGSHVYIWLSSLPSGHPFTVFINCLYGLFNFRFAWVDLHDGDVSCLMNFEDHVVMCVLGDDVIYAVSDEYLERFNDEFLHHSLKKIGMNATSADKSALGKDMKTLEEIQFLKRTFRFCPLERRWVAPLQLDVILEMPYWTKRQSNKDQIVCDTMNMAIRELTLHGKIIFDRYIDIFANTLNERYGEWPRTTDFYVLYKDVLNSEVWY